MSRTVGGSALADDTLRLDSDQHARHYKTLAALDQSLTAERLVDNLPALAGNFLPTVVLTWTESGSPSGIYRHVLQEFVIFEKNGSVSLDGTSAVASLIGDVDFSVSEDSPFDALFTDSC